MFIEINNVKKHYGEGEMFFTSREINRRTEGCLTDIEKARFPKLL